VSVCGVVRCVCVCMCVCVWCGVVCVCVVWCVCVCVSVCGVVCVCVYMGNGVQTFTISVKMARVRLPHTSDSLFVP